MTWKWIAIGWMFLQYPMVVTAQRPHWLVTKVGSSSQSDREVTAKVVEQLRAQNYVVIDPDQAAALFESRHSKAPVLLPPNELEKLQQAIASLSHHLALENLTEAQKSLKVLNDLTPDVADYLNRKMARAKQLFQACLLTAYLMRKGGYREKAYRQVAECVRTFPGFEPDRQHYPPHIISIFYRAAAEINATTPATIQVGVTSGRGCRARINGVDWGPVPTKVPGIRSEQVRIQVECGDKSGRIYTKKIQPGNNPFQIDARFDRVVCTEGGLLLKYTSAADRQTYRFKDSIYVAQVVGATRIVLIDTDEQFLYWIDVASSDMAARVPYSGGILVAATEKLLASKTPPPSDESEKTPADPVLPSEQSHLFHDPTYWGDSNFETLVWGYAAAGVSLAALGTGWVYWLIRKGERDDHLRTDQEGDYHGYEVPIGVFTGVGSLGLTASIPAILPRTAGVPWWSYLFGATGVGLAAYGIYIWQGDEYSCLQYSQNGGCLKSSNKDKFGGAFLTMQSLPLLSVPVTYLIRHMIGEHSVSSIDTRGVHFWLGCSRVGISGRW